VFERQTTDFAQQSGHSATFGRVLYCANSFANFFMQVASARGFSSLFAHCYSMFHPPWFGEQNFA
jgi:hypothetical protein